MKITTESPVKSFQPIAFKVLLETQEEFDILNNILAHDISVPNAVALSAAEREKTTLIIQDLRRGLREAAGQ